MDLIFRLLAIIIRLVDKLLRPFNWLRRIVCKSKRIPPIDNEIFLFTATDIAGQIREKKLTSLYVVASFIGRIKQVNPIINAVSEECFDAALIEAQTIDKFLQQTKMSEEELAREMPFLGVPVTIKESCGVKGMSQAVGSLMRKGIKCEADCATVKRLRSAGFILLAVTNCPEFCVGLETSNLLNGTTKNPYDQNYSVGGSSGGEAALLSAAASVVGVGSDYAGSIRFPCMFTGIFGHKTTPKIIPRKMHFPDSTDPESYDYFSIGPMTRYVTDLRPILKVMCTEEGAANDALKLNEKVDLRKINVFYTRDYYNLFGMEKVSEEIRKGLRQARKYLQNECGMNVKVAKFQQLENSVEISTSLFLNATDMPKFLEDPTDPEKNLNIYVELFKSICGTSMYSIHLLVCELIIRYNAFLPRSHVPYYKRKMQELQKSVWDTLGDNGVLLYPTFPSSAFQHYGMFTKFHGISYAMIFNIIGCPVTQIPIGLDNKGLPIGIQIVAGPKQDRLCLAVAEVLEQCFGGWVPPS